MRVPEAVSNAISRGIANIMMLQEHTRATHDSTSSGPIPAPRTRPRRRKPTTAAHMTQRTAIAMSESRACLVMAIYSAPAMMDSAWRWRRGVRGLMRDWGQRSSHGEREINITLKLESSHGQCYYGSNLHYGITSPIQGLQKRDWRSRVSVCPGSPDFEPAVDGDACQGGPCVKCQV